MHTIGRNPFFRRLTAAAAFLALAACGGNDATGPATPPEPVVDGLYTLVSVNGQPLPFTIFSNTAGRFTHDSGSITLRPDLSFTERSVRSIAYFNDPNQNVTGTEMEHGTYSLAGVSLILTYTGGASSTSYQGTLADGTVRYVFNSNVYEYRR